MMKIKFGHGFPLTVLAVIFTIALTFAAVELPRVLDSFVDTNFRTPDIDSHAGELNMLKTEMFIQHYHIREIGYACFFLILIFIITGFVTHRSGLASTGAIALFLPVFGHFAMTMFFLSGLGILYSAWMPFLDISYEVLRLGSIIYFPYKLLLDILSVLGISARNQLPFIIGGIGFFIFIMGTTAWFYSRIKGKNIADFWIYRFSRHPQYLGWIIWSFGIILMPGNNMKKTWDVPNTLPWLISTMIIIGVAWLEEIKLKKECPVEYDTYCRQAPFLFPIPHFLKKIVTFPAKLLIKKENPANKKEVAGMVLVYTVILLILSPLFDGTVTLSKVKNLLSPVPLEKQISHQKENFCGAVNRRTKFAAAEKLAATGKSSIQVFISLLNDPDQEVREFSAQKLGQLKSPEAVQPLIMTLNDSQWRVATEAILALGKIGSENAIDHLIPLLKDNRLPIRTNAARALAQIGATRVIDSLIMGLNDKERYGRIAIAEALGELKAERAIEPIACFLTDPDKNVRCTAVIALFKIGSPKAIPALEKSLFDEDWEVRFYAKEVLKRLSKGAIQN
jgi:hypothetical protein